MGSHDVYEEGVDKVCNYILESLRKKTVSRVILDGEAGIGKTWMARKIYENATSEKGWCCIALWLSLNKEIDEMSLYEDIASQLSFFPENEDSDDDDIDMGNDEVTEEQKTQDLLLLQDMLSEKFKKEKRRNGEGKKDFLLVLDDEGSVTSENKVMKDLHLGKVLASYGPKILITRRKREDDAMYMLEPEESYDCPDSGSKSDSDEDSGEPDSDDCSGGETRFRAMKESNVLPAKDELHASRDSITIDVSQILRDTFTDNYLGSLLLKSLNNDELLESLEKALDKDNGFLKHRIVEMSMRFPATVVVLAKSLNSFAKNHFSPRQKELFETAVLSSFPPQTNDCGRATSRRNPILRFAYELLETNDTTNSSIADCFWHSLSFFQFCGCVNYQELIAHWILEGYFDPVKSVTKAYKDGHKNLITLMDCGFLKIQEDNVVKPEIAMENLIDLRRRGLLGRSRIGLAKVFGSDKTKGLGKTNLVDDIIEAVQGTRKREKIITVLVSGNRLRREKPEKFFENLKDLEILGLFKPTLYQFVPSVFELVKLRVLVIRDCDLLEDIEKLKALQRLHALEISGASSLKQISDGFFMAMPNLQSLHLSGLQIRTSPSSISQLKELHCLIIKDCPVLEDLPDIQELVKLEVFDASGAWGLQTCFDKEIGEIKNKNFMHLKNLQFLDLSESQIKRLPIFQDSADPKMLHSLTRLILHDCSKLRTLPNLKPLSGLQILDLSGATSLVQMLEVCFEDKKELMVLNLSGTSIRQLPTTIEEMSNLNELLLRDCTNLEALPNIQTLTNLEVFDVSGCAKLHSIEGSFEDMSYLRDINFSGTNLMTLPEFPKESKLCCLKRITLADKRLFEGEDWRKIVKAMQSGISTNYRSSDAVIKSKKISAKEAGEIQSSEPGSSDFRGKRGITKEGFRQFPIYKALYQKSIPFVETESDLKLLEISETNSLVEEPLIDAETVSFVDCSSTRLTSIFNEIKFVKCCWLRMCKDIRYLFAGVEDEYLGSLEILSITNLRLLDSICSGGSFKNLKKLSIDCCPNIKTLFLEASQLPSSLEVLNIKRCEKLEKVFKEGEVTTLTILCLYELPVLSDVGATLPNLETFKKGNCPKLCWATKETLRGSDWDIVEHHEESSYD